MSNNTFNKILATIYQYNIKQWYLKIVKPHGKGINQIANLHKMNHNLNPKSME
jgi:hypothetical protein